MLDALLRDGRHAVRALFRRPTYAVVVIVTLALVIGAATAVVAVVSATMVRPLPFPESDRLVQIFTMPPGRTEVIDRNPLDTRVFVRFRDSLRQVEAFDGIWVRDRALDSDDGEPESVTAGAVSPGIFALFGGRPILGRTFTVEEDRDDAKLTVLSHGLWQRRFGGDPAIIGRTVSIDRDPHLVVGIMPPSFRVAYSSTELWTPLHASEAGFSTFATFTQTFARLTPTATVAQLQSELEARMQPVIAESPATLTGWSARVTSLREAQFGSQQTSLLALIGAIAALASIACANLANLTLAQAASRRAEWALRAALGGGRAAILRLQMVETSLLAATGWIAGLLLGAWILPALRALDPTTARTFGDVAIDWRVQAAMAALTGMVALLSGVLPVLRQLRGNVAGGIADGSRRAIGSRRDLQARQWLVGAECAAAVVLLASGAVLVSAFDGAARIDPGFDPTNVLGAQMRVSASAYPTEARRAEFITRVLDRVRTIPGVVAAASTLNSFTPGNAFVTLIDIEGQPTADGQQHTVQFRRVSRHYFDTMRIPLLRGRDFNESDRLDSQAVVIVSRQLAERFWPGRDPIGQGVRRGQARRLLTVMGVVDDVRDVTLLQAPAPTLYVPFTQNNVAIAPVSIVVRMSSEPLASARAISAAVLEVDPAQPLDHLTTLDQFLSDSLGPQRFRSTLLLILSGLGLAMAGIGIYGVTSRAVGERTRELGVRLALGASAAGVARLVIWQALRAVLAGLTAGVLLAVPALVLLLKTLPNVEHAEPWAVVPVLLVLLVVAATAAAVPAHRAIGLDPTTALRAE
jgi:putative ABC transport system permease protein